MQIISRSLNHEPCKDGWNREVPRVFRLYRPQHIKHFKNPQNHEVLPRITCLKRHTKSFPTACEKKGHPIAPACWGVNLCILPKDWINSLHCKIAKHFLDGFNPSEKYQSDIVRFDHHFQYMGTEENVSSHQPVLATGTWFEHVPRKPDVRPPAKRWNIQETTTATSGRLPLLTFIIEDSWQVTRKLKIPHPRKTICSIGIFNKQPPLLREDYRYLLSLRIQKVSGGQTSGLQRTCFGQSKTTWTKSGIELGAPSSQTFPCFPITVHGVQLLKINIRVSKPLARCLWPSVTNGQWFRAENGKLRRLRGKSGIL